MQGYNKQESLKITTPSVYIFAGVNGAGKTTLYYNELELGKDLGKRINIDEIVSSFGDWRSRKDQFRASKIALKLRKSYISTKQDFNLETTLCGSSIISLFDTLKQNGYYINLYYIGLDSISLAKERVKIRVAKGGHNIDEKLIEKRYGESLDNLATIANLCDKVVIFDNSTTKENKKEYIKLLEYSNGILKTHQHREYLNGVMSKIYPTFKNTQQIAQSKNLTSNTKLHKPKDKGLEL